MCKNSGLFVFYLVSLGYECCYRCSIVRLRDHSATQKLADTKAVFAALHMQEVAGKEFKTAQRELKLFVK